MTTPLTTRPRPLGRRRIGSAARLAAGATVAITLLTGCGAGSGDSELGNPSDAAVVNGEAISKSSADDFAADYCDLYEPQFKEAKQKITMGYLRSATLDLLVRDRLVRELVDERDLEFPAEYDQVITDLRGQAKMQGVPPGKSTETWLRSQTLDTYANTAFLVMGMERAGDTEMPQDEATYTARVQAGQEEYAAWVEKQDVTRNPAYGTGGQTTQYVGPAGFSVPVSGQAKFDATPPELGNAEYLDGAKNLPANQVCG